MGGGSQARIIASDSTLGSGDINGILDTVISASGDDGGVRVDCQKWSWGCWFNGLIEMYGLLTSISDQSDWLGFLIMGMAAGHGGIPIMSVEIWECELGMQIFLSSCERKIKFVRSAIKQFKMSHSNLIRTQV